MDPRRTIFFAAATRTPRVFPCSHGCRLAEVNRNDYRKRLPLSEWSMADLLDAKAWDRWMDVVDAGGNQ